MGEVSVDKLQQNAQGVFLSAKALAQLAFHEVGKAEASRNGKQYRQNRHNGEQRTIGKRRCLLCQPVFGKTGKAEIDSFDDVVNRKRSSIHLVFRNAPNVVSKELP